MPATALERERIYLGRRLGRGRARAGAVHDVALRWRDAHPCDATSPRCASPHGMTWHGMACTLGSPYGGAHGGDLTHEGNRGAVPPLCAATSRAKTVLNTGRHLKSAERQRGRGCMIRMCNTIIRMASFVQPPRQGRGPASGGEGTADRMCACGAMRPWHAAARSSAGCARPWHAAARSSAGCAGVCGRYLCASSPLDAVRAACGLEAKPSAVVERDEARSRPRYGLWNGSLHFDRALYGLWTLRDGAACTLRGDCGTATEILHILRFGSPDCGSACRRVRDRVVVGRDVNHFNHKTAHTCAPAHRTVY